MSRPTALCAYAAALLVLSTAPAHAYLDPGTGSMILQALIGGLAGALVFGRNYLAGAKNAIVQRFRASRRPGGTAAH